MDKFEFPRSKAKVKDTAVVLEKQKCHHSSAFIYGPVFAKLHSMTIFWDKFYFENSRS